MAKFTLTNAPDFYVPNAPEVVTQNRRIWDMSGIGNLVFTTWSNNHFITFPNPNFPPDARFPNGRFPASPDFRLYEYDLTSKTYRIIELPWTPTDTFYATNMDLAYGVAVNETHIFTANGVNTVGNPRGGFINAFTRNGEWIGASKVTSNLNHIGSMALDNEMNIWVLTNPTSGTISVYPLSQILSAIGIVDQLLVPSAAYSFNDPATIISTGIYTHAGSLFASGIRPFETDGNPVGRWNINTIADNRQPEDQLCPASNSRVPDGNSSMYIFEGRYYGLYSAGDDISAWNPDPSFPDGFSGVPPPDPGGIVDTDGDMIDDGNSVIVIGDGETEGTYTVVLTSQPTGDVTVRIDVPDDSGVTTDVATLTFTPKNWNVPQTVTVTVDTDPVTIDPPTLTFTPDNWNVYQGVVLTNRPTENVEIPVTVPDGSGVTTNVETLIFTPENWNVSQPIILTSQPTADVIVTFDLPENIRPARPDTLITHSAVGGGYDDVIFSSVLITSRALFCIGGVSRLRYADPLAGDIPVSTEKGVLGTIPTFIRASNKSVLTLPPAFSEE